MPQGLHLLAPRNTEDFSLVPLHCPRGYIFSPPEALRTFHWCLYIAPGVTSSRPRSTEDFPLVPLRCPRGYIFSPPEALRTFHSSSPALARRRGGLYLASERARALRSFNWCLRSPKDDEDFNFNWCLRSPKDDEDLTLTGASDRRKTMRT